MRTHEKIDGQSIDIDWSFEKKTEVLRPHEWYVWTLLGESDDGRKFTGICEAGDDTSFHDIEVTCIEEIETVGMSDFDEDLPLENITGRETDL